MSKNDNARFDAGRRSRRAMAKAGRFAGSAAVAAALVAGLFLSSAANGRQEQRAAPPSPASADAINNRSTQISRVVDGVRFSLALPSWWEQGPHMDHARNGLLNVTKSTVGPQGAEVVMFWTSFPRADRAAACTSLTRPHIGPSTAHLAAVVANAPGTTLVKGPSLVTVGGRAAHHVVLKVRKDVGCDPGFFYTWQPRGRHGFCGGACWLESRVGDTIRVWIVSVGGTRLFIEAETNSRAGRSADREIRRIVGSIHFD